MFFTRKVVPNNEDKLVAESNKTPKWPSWFNFMYMLTDPFCQNALLILIFPIAVILLALLTTPLIAVGSLCVSIYPFYCWLQANALGTGLPADWKYGPLNVSSKNVLVTGSNTGMGLAAAEQLLKWNAQTIYIACRDSLKGEKAVNKLSLIKEQKGLKTDIKLVRLDLSDLSSVKECAEKVTNDLSAKGGLHLLINNAGVMACPFSTTKNGYEMQWGTNHLGHFYLTQLLLPLLKSAGTEETPARVIVYASLAHAFVGFQKYMGLAFSSDLICTYLKSVSPDTYAPHYAYGFSKISNILFAKGLQRRLNEEGCKSVKVYSVQPGAVQTELARHTGAVKTIMQNSFFQSMFSKTALRGAETALFCATAPVSLLAEGEYYADCVQLGTIPEASKKDNEDKMWELSEFYLKKAGF